MAINNPNEKPKQIGSGFTNLQSLMRANQGNKLGQAVSSGIQRTGEHVQEGVKRGQEEFQTQSKANQLGTQEQKQNVENVLKDPTQATESDISNFAKYRSGQYKGPEDIANAANLKGQAEQAQGLGQAIGSEGGRQALLQRFAAGPGQYQAGQQRLDTLLLGATPGNQLQAARRSVSGLSNQVGGAQSAAQQQAQQFKKQAAGFGQDVTNQTGQAQANVYNPAKAAAQQANITEQQTSEAAGQEAQKAGQNQLSQRALESLGLTAGQRTYGANLGQFIDYKGAETPATALNVMTQPQFQQYSQLQRLMGQAPSVQPQNPYQAGSVAYNKEAAQAAIQGRHAEIAPKEQQLAQARDISDRLSQIDQMNNQARFLQGQNNPGWENTLQAAKDMEQALSQQYMGNNQGIRRDWAASNLASRLKDIQDTDAGYGQTVSKI